VVVSLPCTNLGSAVKLLKESDLVVTRPGKFVWYNFLNTKTTFSFNAKGGQCWGLVENS